MTLDRWRTLQLGEVMSLEIDAVTIDDDQTYRIAGVYSFAQGLFERDPLRGTETSYTRFHRLHEGQLVLSRLKAWEGALALVPDAFAGAHLSTEFPTFRCDPEQLLPQYAWLVVQRPDFWATLKSVSSGMGGRKTRVKAKAFLSVSIPIPPLPVQQRIIDLLDHVDRVRSAVRRHKEAAERTGVSLRKSIFQAVDEYEPLGDHADVQLGKMLSRKAREGPSQRPYLRNANVQWDRIESDDLNTMSFDDRESEKFELRAGDLLVCEGGEVGRAAMVTERHEHLLYQKALHRVRCHHSLSPRFLLHFLRYASDTGGFTDYATKTTIAHLTREKLLMLPVPIPPRGRQDKHVAVLDGVTEVRDVCVGTAAQLDVLRGPLLTRLVQGQLTLPDSYDRFLDEIAA